MFVSSHLMSEMEPTAEHLVVIGRGRLIADVALGDFTTAGLARQVCGCAPPGHRASACCSAGPDVDDLQQRSAASWTSPVSPWKRWASGPRRPGICLYELSPQRASLEDVFMELTRDCLEYQATARTCPGRGEAR